MSMNRPCKVVVSSRTRIGSPSAKARARQASRTGPNPFSRQRRTQISKRRTKAANAASGVGAGRPSPASEVAGNSASDGAETRLSPTPTIRNARLPLSRGFRFKQNAGDFSSSRQHVVRPLVGNRGKRGSELRERLTDAQSGDKGELRRALGRAGRAQDDRSIKIAWWRRPNAAAPAASGRLPQPANDGSFRGPGAGEFFGFIVGAADGLAQNQSIRRGKQRRRHSHRAKSDAAATSALPITGPGSRKKSRVTKAVTTSRPFNSLANGASKLPTGSSKYMTLTTRK